MEVSMFDLWAYPPLAYTPLWLNGWYEPVRNAFVPEHDLAIENHNQFWDRECKLHPEALGCRDFDE